MTDGFGSHAQAWPRAWNLARLVLGWAGLRAFARRPADGSPMLAFALAAVTTYMVVTGLVYNIVLRTADIPDIMLGWSNTIHHVIAPAFLTAPDTGSPPWYPYPFLDPNETPGGWLGVSLWVAGIAGLIGLIGWLVILVGRRWPRFEAPDGSGMRTPRPDEPGDPR